MSGGTFWWHIPILLYSYSVYLLTKNPPSFYLPEKFFIYLSFWNDIFSGYRILIALVFFSLHFKYINLLSSSFYTFWRDNCYNSYLCSFVWKDSVFLWLHLNFSKSKPDNCFVSSQFAYFSTFIMPCFFFFVVVVFVKSRYIMHDRRDKCSYSVLANTMLLLPLGLEVRDEWMQMELCWVLGFLFLCWISVSQRLHVTFPISVLSVMPGLTENLFLSFVWF